MNDSSPSVAILGAGISGLSIAWYLKKQGIESVVYEKSAQPGGVIGSHGEDGWLWESGPNTLMVRSRRVWELIEEADLDGHVLEANRSAQKRYIVKEGRPSPLPMSVWDLLTTDLFSTPAKFRLLKEPFIAPAGDARESIADFVTRRLGNEILDYAVNPFISGIFAGEPEKLSIKHTFPRLYEAEKEHGSLLKGMVKKTGSSSPSSRKGLISIEGGLQTLPLALADRLGAVKPNRRLTSLEKVDKKWILQFDNGDEARHRLVISTLPAYALAEVLPGGSDSLNELKNINYAPISVIAMGYKRERVSHPLDGFGMLVPRKEHGFLLGTLFSSTLFPGRAPEGHVLLTSFVGGARSPGRALLPRDELVAGVQYDLDRLLGISGTPAFVGHHRWERAVPQYEVGYDLSLDALNKIENENAGLFVAGNYRGGVSVPDCIENGFETAEKVGLLLNR